MLWICRYLPWLFVNPFFKVSDAASLKSGDILISHRAHHHRFNEVRVLVSAAQSTELKQGAVDWFFLSLYFGDFDNKHYPTPETIFTTDAGIAPYADGKMSETRSTYRLPVEFPQQQLAELITGVKIRWASLIRYNNLLHVEGSPFV